MCTNGVGVLVAVHLEVFLHTRDVGVHQVGLVEKLHEESETADDEDGEIKLEQEPQLGFALEV